MPDALTTITHLINSPPGQLAAGDVWQAIAVQFGLGLGLFYGVTKFFDVVGDRLNDDTKLEIAVWLLGVKVGQKVEPWPDTFAKVFDRVYGEHQLSWQCFKRSCITTYITLLIQFFLFISSNPKDPSELMLPIGVLATLPTVFIPDYVFLLKTRRMLSAMIAKPSKLLLYLLIDSTVNAVAIILSLLGPWSFVFVFNAIGLIFGSLWLWLYAGSGFILKSARRFDIGFDWFNRKFDIEKKPLQSIGLVAGALVAVVYWTVVIVSRVVG
jgi:hypothetical protein